MKTLISKYPGKCFECGQAFKKGTPVKYYGRMHIQHANCPNKENANEDYACSDMGYEDRCAEACGFGL